MFLPDPDPRMIAGGTGAQMAQRLYSQGQGAVGGASRTRRVQPTLTSPSRQVMSGRAKQEQARKYYFGGQQAFTQGYQSFALTDPVRGILGDSLSPEAMNIARNKAAVPRPEAAMAEAPKGYYVWFGNIVKTVGDNKQRQYMAGRLTELRQFGMLGAEPYEEQNKETYKRLQDLRDRLAHGWWYQGQGTMAKPHTRPEAPGQFVLGSMQGARVRAFERRQAAKAVEETKDDLRRATETGNPLQQEAKIVERAEVR